MAPKGTKRTLATSTAWRPAKKACDDIIATKCGQIAATLREQSELPATVVAMLASGAVGCFRSVKEKRHELQEELAGWIGGDLASIEASLEAAVANARAQLDGEKAAHASAKAEAEKELEKSRAVSVEAKAVVVADIAARESASAALVEALEAQREGDQETDASAALKAEVERAMSEAYAPLKEGTVSDGDAVDNLMKVIGKLNLDASLLQALPTALAKTPADRGAFDRMAIEQLAELVRAQQDELTATLAVAAPAREARAAKVAAAQEVANAAAEKAKASATAFNQAEAVVKQYEASLEDATKAFEDFVAGSESAESACDQKALALKDFQEGPLAAFKELFDRSVEHVAVETAEAGA